MKPGDDDDLTHWQHAKKVLRGAAIALVLIGGFCALCLLYLAS
jgi:hypothetical protein